MKPTSSGSSSSRRSSKLSASASGLPSGNNRSAASSSWRQRVVAAATLARARNSTAYAVSPFGVNLPSGFNLSQGDVETVVGALGAIIDRG